MIKTVLAVLGAVYATSVAAIVLKSIVDYQDTEEEDFGIQLVSATSIPLTSLSLEAQQWIADQIVLDETDEGIEILEEFANEEDTR